MRSTAARLVALWSSCFPSVFPFFTLSPQYEKKGAQNGVVAYTVQPSVNLFINTTEKQNWTWLHSISQSKRERPVDGLQISSAWRLNAMNHSRVQSASRHSDKIPVTNSIPSPILKSTKWISALLSWWMSMKRHADDVGMYRSGLSEPWSRHTHSQKEIREAKILGEKLAKEKERGKGSFTMSVCLDCCIRESWAY